MPRTVPFLFAALLSLGVLVSGCAAAAQQAVQQATGVDVKQGGNQVTVKGSDGSSMTVDSSLPAELKDFPVPQGFTSQGGGTMTMGADKLAAVSWKGTGQVQTVLDFYKTSMPAKGWKEDSTLLSGDGGLLNYSKPDGYGVTVTVGKEEGNNITIAVLAGKSSKTPTPRAEAAAAKQQAAATSRPEATSTPEATETPAAPKTGDVSALPAELKDIPVPSGFAPIQGKSVRMASGGKFQSAAADFFGKASVKDASTFFSSTLPNKGWDVDVEEVGEEEATFVCTNRADPSLHLAVNVTAEDAGTKIYVQVMKS